jgi:hypothetical protein
MSDLFTSQIVRGFLLRRANLLAAAPVLAQEDAKELLSGKGVLSRIDLNIKEGKDPLVNISDENLKKAFGYVILKRENPVLEEGDHLNYEGAIAAKDREDDFKDREELEEAFVKQVNRLEGALSKKLSLEKGKVSIVDEKD